MTNGGVTEQLCEERREHFETKLRAIAEDAREACQGVGKLLRIITEGNGQEAITVQVSRNSEFRERMEQWISTLESEQRERRAERNRARLAIWLAVGGWAVTIVIAVAGFLT